MGRPDASARFITRLARQGQRAADEPQVQLARRGGQHPEARPASLAAGKGVVVTDERPVALAHGRACLTRGSGRVVVEDYLDGPEASVFCVCDGATVRLRRGASLTDFADRIDVNPDEQVTAWELYGKRHGYMACLPHGRVRVVRHDVPEDDNANIVNPR